MTDKFAWTDEAEKAAELLAQGNLSDAKIAAQVGKTRMTLYRWRQHPDFAARIEEHLERYRAQVRRRGLAVLDRRVASLNDRWMRMRRVMKERADDPKMANVPGGRTGLIVHDVKGVGKGDDFELIDLYSVDTGLLKELREHERQAAQELGQWGQANDRLDLERRKVDAAIPPDAVPSVPDVIREMEDADERYDREHGAGPGEDGDREGAGEVPS